MAKGQKTGGRVSGTPNKVTSEIRAEIRDLAWRLFDSAYWAATKGRLETGKLAPAIEVRLLAYAYGEPTQTVDVPQLAEIAAALNRKVIHELHPGPTKGP